MDQYLDFPGKSKHFLSRKVKGTVKTCNTTSVKMVTNRDARRGVWASSFGGGAKMKNEYP